MDIAINKNIEYKDLNNFLQDQFGAFGFFLIYDGVNTWDNVEGQKAIFHYLENEEMDQGFKYGLCVYVKIENMLALIENIASELSRIFKCATFCDASRVILKDQNPYYSLLFEDGKVYLVDDFIYEDTGHVTKVVELAYEHPVYSVG